MSAHAVAMRARSLACAVGGRTVLHDVDLDVGTGQMVAVVGVNGSGKSTLLRTLSGLLAPVSGRAEIDGRDVHGMSARERAREIAYVAQEEQPPADMRVGELVALGRLPYRPPWSRGADDRRLALEALDRVGMADAVDRACADLSGGERRRVSLARGLVQDCDLIVLDEPTNHLDVRHQVELLHQLRATGRTVLTAIHDLGLAASHFDHVVVLHDGGVLTAGPPEVALTARTVQDVFGVRATHLLDEQGHQHLVVGPGRPVTSPARPTQETHR
ncbi:ABC transporter ATP-binding protein [Solicola sp. PLA-1-18]|uniref:ABC transporter ATP-binding protein n=1 Tax=Solicola sp. PLA-1-18 TaxID=3380532 RepID=UPI003B7DC0FE